MAAPRWTITNGVPFALSATPKTLLALIAAADVRPLISELSVSIDSTQIVYVELCESTGATAGTPGTSTAASVFKQIGNFTKIDSTTPTVTGGGNYSAEPTVLTRIKHWYFTGPGPFVLQSPMGREPESLGSAATKYRALMLRVSVLTGTPNGIGYLEFEQG